MGDRQPDEAEAVGLQLEQLELTDHHSLQNPETHAWNTNDGAGLQNEVDLEAHMWTDTTQLSPHQTMPTNDQSALQPQQFGLQVPNPQMPPHAYRYPPHPSLPTHYYHQSQDLDQRHAGLQIMSIAVPPSVPPIPLFVPGHAQTYSWPGYQQFNHTAHSPSFPEVGMMVSGHHYRNPLPVDMQAFTRQFPFHGRAPGPQSQPIVDPTLSSRTPSQFSTTPFGRPNDHTPEAGEPLHYEVLANREQEQDQRKNSELRPSSIVRGPPRKPRQTGHALWIGNLAPGADIMDVVRHLCSVAPGLDSLFLISKSNCAFANYEDQKTCSYAQQQIHNSLFEHKLLVCRLRRAAVPTPVPLLVPNAPTGPKKFLSVKGNCVNGAPSGPAALARDTPPSTQAPAAKTDEEQSSSPAVSRNSCIDRYFIVKSLLVQDLEQSVVNRAWATQAHNEKTLSTAYADSENVYLIFSANRSREYFGYARMNSPINNDPAAAIKFAPQASADEDPHALKAIHTPATDFVPEGRIIDDSSRWTLFWEVVREDTAEETEVDEDGNVNSFGGKPFQIEWRSTDRLSFERVRGLYNPWNHYREVKIARDGQELETNLGRRIVEMFHE